MTTDKSKHQHFIYYLIMMKSLLFQYGLSEGARNKKNTKIGFVKLTDHQAVTFDNMNKVGVDPTRFASLKQNVFKSLIQKYIVLDYSRFDNFVQ